MLSETVTPASARPGDVRVNATYPFSSSVPLPVPSVVYSPCRRLDVTVGPPAGVTADALLVPDSSAFDVDPVVRFSTVNPAEWLTIPLGVWNAVTWLSRPESSSNEWLSYFPSDPCAAEITPPAVSYWAVPDPVPSSAADQLPDPCCDRVNAVVDWLVVRRNSPGASTRPAVPTAFGPPPTEVFDPDPDPEVVCDPLSVVWYFALTSTAVVGGVWSPATGTGVTSLYLPSSPVDHLELPVKVPSYMNQLTVAGVPPVSIPPVSPLADLIEVSPVRPTVSFCFESKSARTFRSPGSVAVGSVRVTAAATACRES